MDTTTMEVGDETDSEDDDEDMPPLSPRVVNLSDARWHIRQEYAKDGMSDAFVQERLKWSRLNRPLLDGRSEERR